MWFYFHFGFVCDTVNTFFKSKIKKDCHHGDCKWHSLVCEKLILTYLHPYMVMVMVMVAFAGMFRFTLKERVLSQYHPPLEWLPWALKSLLALVWKSAPNIGTSYSILCQT